MESTDVMVSVEADTERPRVRVQLCGDQEIDMGLQESLRRSGYVFTGWSAQRIGGEGAQELQVLLSNSTFSSSEALCGHIEAYYISYGKTPQITFG